MNANKCFEYLNVVVRVLLTNSKDYIILTLCNFKIDSCKNINIYLTKSIVV